MEGHSGGSGEEGYGDDREGRRDVGGCGGQPSKGGTSADGGTSLDGRASLEGGSSVAVEGSKGCRREGRLWREDETSATLA